MDFFSILKIGQDEKIDAHKLTKVWLSLSLLSDCDTHFFLIRNVRLKLGKNYKTFKKYKQAKFQTIALKTCFIRKFFIK